MKLSTLVLLFLLAFFQVSAKPSSEFAEEESESEQFADELDTLQEEWNLEDLADLQFEEGELEDFLSEEAEQKNPEKVLNQRTSIIKKILQLQERLQSLVITPGGFSLGGSGNNQQLLELLYGGNLGGNLGSFGGNNNQLLQLLLSQGNLGGSGNNQQLLELLYGGNLGGNLNLGGNSKKQQKQWNKLLQQLYGGSSNPFGSFGSSSKELTKLLKQLSKGNNGNLWSLFQNPYILQNPQLLYYLLQLQGGQGFKLPKNTFKIPKAPKVKAPKQTGSQMCWCPCQQANAPTQTFNGNTNPWAVSSPFVGSTFGTTGLGFGTTGVGFGSPVVGFGTPGVGFGTTGVNAFPFGTFSEVETDENESQQIVTPYQQ